MLSTITSALSDVWTALLWLLAWVAVAAGTMGWWHVLVAEDEDEL
ncbi:hypothetical protein VQH23_07525 [Pararoseomonas sp. SCSIO 73927]